MTGVRCRTSSSQTDYGYSRFVDVDSPLLVLICVGGETRQGLSVASKRELSRDSSTLMYIRQNKLCLSESLNLILHSFRRSFLLFLSSGSAVDVNHSTGNGSRYQGTITRRSDWACQQPLNEVTMPNGCRLSRRPARQIRRESKGVGFLTHRKC